MSTETPTSNMQWIFAYLEKAVVPTLFAAIASLGTWVLNFHKFDVEHSEKFVDKAMGRDFESRYRLAEYFANHSDTKKQWTEYFELLKIERQKASETKKELMISQALHQADLDNLRSEPMIGKDVSAIKENIKSRYKAQAMVAYVQSEIDLIDNRIKVQLSTEQRNSLPVFASGWIYIGQKDDTGKNWQERTTDALDDPKPGDTIHTTTKVYLRSSLPTYIGSRPILGTSIDTVSSTEILKILEIKNTGLGDKKHNYWARVERVGSIAKN